METMRSAKAKSDPWVNYISLPSAKMLSEEFLSFTLTCCNSFRCPLALIPLPQACETWPFYRAQELGLHRKQKRISQGKGADKSWYQTRTIFQYKLLRGCHCLICCTGLMQNKNSCSPDLVDHGQISFLFHLASLVQDSYPLFHQQAFPFSFKKSN